MSALDSKAQATRSTVQHCAIHTLMAGISGESCHSLKGLLCESGSLQVNLIVRRPLAMHRNSILHPSSSGRVNYDRNKEGNQIMSYEATETAEGRAMDGQNTGL